MSNALPFIIIAALILLNGLFVAAEFAIAGASRANIGARAAAGNRVARAVDDILSNPRNQDRYIATAQLGITFATLGLGMYGEHELAVMIYDATHGASWLDWAASHLVASIAAVVVMTYFHVVIGEMVPKALALQRAEQTAIAVTPAMLWIKRIMFPFVVLLNGTGNLILKLIGVRRETTSEQFYTPEELQFIVRESGESGLLMDESARMLHELFEFSELHARDAMVPRVQVRGIPVGATTIEMREILREEAHTRYPVFERDLDHIVGTLHVKDLLRIIRRRGPLTRNDARPVPFLPETSRLDVVMDAMRKSRAQMVIVLDEQGGTAGIVTIEDLFDEIIGEFDSDTGPADIGLNEDTTLFRVEGTTRLDEVGEHFGFELEHEEVETVSGLVLALLDRPAEPGDRVEWEGLAFEVEATSGHGVKDATVTLLQPEDDDQSDVDS